MGLEFLFSPATFLMFMLLNAGIVVILRFLFRNGFDAFGIKRVVVGYFSVLALSLALGVILGNGVFRDSTSNFLIASYLSLTFTSVGLLPFSLLLAGRGNFSVGSVILFALVLSVFIGIGMLLSIGIDKIVDRGLFTWLSRQAYILVFLVAVSVAFGMGLKSAVARRLG